VGTPQLQSINMHKLIIYFVIFFAIVFFTNCTGNSIKEIDSKNECYSEKLENLKKTQVYNEVFTQFSKDFDSLKKEMPELRLRPYKIDDAIFFNKNKNECILLILQKPVSGWVYGIGRCIQGVLDEKKWKFEISKQYMLSSSPSSEYEENTFDNLSKLLRYSVLTDGNTSFGCEIDESYWFKHLKK
jgi:hypothetical protein